MVLMSLSAFVITASVYVTVMFIQSISSPESLRQGFIFRHIVPLLPDYWIFRLKGDRTLITAMCMLLVLFIVIKNLIVFVSSAYGNVFVQRIGVYVSREAFGRYLAKDYLWHVSDESAKLMTRIMNRQQLTAMLIDILTIFGNALCAMILCLALFLSRPYITALVFSVFLAVSAIVYIILRRKVEINGRKEGEFSSRQNWVIQMTTRGIREVVIYRKRKIFLDSIVETMREAIPCRTFLAIAAQIPSWFLEVSGFVIIFSVMVYLVDDGNPMPQTIATMSMLLITAWRALPLFNRSMGAAVRIRGARARALSCLELLEGFTEPMAESAAAVDRDLHFGRSIELKEIAFRYPKNKANTLDALSLRIEKGENIGLVGRSGAGKSTLGMIMAGLFQPMEGAMLVDGTDITPGLLDSYRKLVGFVPQNPLLLPGTLAENIALSDWGGEPDRELLESVCRMAGMDFASSGKKGLGFRIGDGGEGLSGGEAQRVSIARALYTNPEILIFDEATSSLDRATEAVIEKTIESLRGKITSIVIAHRLTTVERCDRVVWVEKGGIREVGPPETVLPKYIAESKKG